MIQVGLPGNSVILRTRDGKRLLLNPAEPGRRSNTMVKIRVFPSFVSTCPFPYLSTCGQLSFWSNTLHVYAVNKVL